MKCKSRIVGITMLVVLICLSGCGGTQGESLSNQQTENRQEDNTIKETLEKPTETTTEQITKNEEVSIEEQVIFEQDGIKITAKEIDSDGSWLGTELKILVENETDKGITVQARDVSVNGYMVDTTMSIDVASQKKSNDSLIISGDDLEECGIEQIAEMEFRLHIFDEESWDTIVDTDVITIQTSCFDSYVQEYDDSGEMIYEDEYVKIISKGITDDSIFGIGLKLYIENKTEDNITVQVRDSSVNGFMLDSIFSPEISGGKKAISAITFMSSDIEENGITEFENIETSFHIFYTESWDTIMDTEPIMIEFQ